MLLVMLMSNGRSARRSAKRDPAELAAELQRVRADDAAAHREVERLREQNHRLQELLSDLALENRARRPGRCSHEMTAGTCSGPRRRGA
jgi:uncharacterized membrane protein